MAAESEQQPLSELLPGFVEAVTAVAKLEVPEPSDIYYYRNIPEYKEISSACSSQVQQLLRTARSNLTRPSAAAAAATAPDKDDLDDALFEDLTAVLDDTLERLDVALDASKQQTEQLKLGGWAAPAGVRQAFRVAAQGLTGGGASAGLTHNRVQRHVANLPRPQESFPDPVDNSNTPWDPSRFAHLAPRLAAAAAAARGTSSSTADRLQIHAAQLAAASSSAGSGAGTAPHPYAPELASLSYQPWQLAAPAAAPEPPAELDATPFTFVDTPAGLSAMLSALQGQTQVALDLEHHAYRSFRGFTCLLQVSSRSADWVVDCLALRGQLGAALSGLLADPAVEKVLHGADSDVLWLQRDFGCYIVNMFDTGQAARVLNYPSASLAYLLEKHVGFKADKRYQLADWRLRPLPPDMLHYARCDTHYLLGIADALRRELVAAGPALPQGCSITVPQHSGAGQDALGVVLERSRQLCATCYTSPTFTDTAYLEAAARWSLALPPRNMAVFAALFAWRDATARALDESVSYIMPKASLLELSRAAPATVADLKRLLAAGSGLAGSSGLLLSRAEEVVGIIGSGQQQAPAMAAAAAGGDGGAAAAAGDAVVPRVLPALKPRALPPLTPAAGAGGSRQAGKAAGRLRGAALGGIDKPAAAAATAAQDGDDDAQQQQQPDVVAAPSSEQQQLQQQHVETAAEPPQQVGQPTLLEPNKQQQQQEHQQKETLQDQTLKQDEQQQQQAEPAAAAPAPKQLAAPRVASRGGGSSLAGLLSSKHQNRNKQQQQPAAKAASLKASSFKLAFMSAPAAPDGNSKQDAAAGNGSAMPPAVDQQKQQQQSTDQQQQQQQDSAPAVSGAQVRAVVDQLMAEAAAEDEPAPQLAAAAAGAATATAAGGNGEYDDLFEDTSSDDTRSNKAAASAAHSVSVGGGSSGLADLEYVPLSAQVKKQHGNNQFAGLAAKRRKVDAAAGQGAAAPPPPQPQQHEQQQHKRKRSLFAAAAVSDSDEADSEAEGGPGGVLPSYNPGASRKIKPAEDAAEPEQQQQQGRGGAGGRRGGGRGRGGRDSDRGGRGGRGGRSKRGAFMAAASASLAAVRQGRPGGGGVGANLYDIPDSHLMRGGKRSAVAPRGGNRSASFK